MNFSSSLLSVLMSTVFGFALLKGFGTTNKPSSPNVPMASWCGGIAFPMNDKQHPLS